MTKSKFTLAMAGALVIAALLTRTFVLNQSMTQLREENRRLREQLEQVNDLQNQRERAAKLEGEELERLRKEHSELMRLRGEVGRLRDQVQRLLAKGIPSTTNPASEEPSPFSTLVASVQSTVLAASRRGLLAADDGG